MVDRGFFDLPAVIFDPFQSWLDTWLPVWLSIGLWALLAAFLSMWIYSRLSDQKALSELKARQKDARNRLAVYDGPFNGLMPLIRENLSLSGRHMWLTLYPALLATLPLLFILPWLSNTYGVYFPEPGTPVTIRVKSYTPYGLGWRSVSEIKQTGTGRWIVAWPERNATLALITRDGEPIVTLPPNLPSPLLHKQQWWNALLANPAGYLEPGSIVEEVILDLPEQEFIPFGPAWSRGWLTVFLLGLVMFSLFFKWRWQLR